MSEVFFVQMTESNMADFKMAAIIKLSQNEQVNFFVQNGWIQDSRIQDGCHHQFEWECMSEVFLCKWLNPKWQNSRWLPSSSWVRMNEWSFFVQNGRIQDGRIQDFKMAAIIKLVRINEFESDWIIWVRVRVESFFERRCKWWQNWQDGCHHQVESEWMSEVLFVQDGWIQDGIQMAAIIKSECCAKWLNPRSEFKIAVESEWMSKVFLCRCWELVLKSWVWVQELMAESKMAEFKMDCHHQVKWEWMSLSQIELVWVRVRMEWECFLSESDRR